MRLSETGWSNDLPDSPGWYSICRQKELDWWLSNMWPYLVRVDYVNGVLMVTEDPEWEHVDDDLPPHLLEIDPAKDQSWMRRAYKNLESKKSFNDRDIPDVIGLAGYAPEELEIRADEQARRSEHFKRQIYEVCAREDALQAAGNR